jgi:phosphoglycolate phosphatase
MEMRFTTVIMDFDGTLFDTREAISQTLAATFETRGVQLPPKGEIEATLASGITLEETLKCLRPEIRSDADVAEWVTAYRTIYNSGLGVRASAPFIGIPAVLKALSKTATPLVIVSNKGEAAVHNTLNHFGLSNAVGLVIAASGASPTKPDPRSFHDRIRPVIGEAATAMLMSAMGLPLTM